MIVHVEQKTSLPSEDPASGIEGMNHFSFYGDLQFLKLG